MSDLSFLTPVHPEQGKCQWVKCQMTGIDKTNPVRTHTAGIPHLMPGTIILVHGVNSEGEWYEDAARQFAEGLNKRLGRVDLQLLDKKNKTDVRFLRENKDGSRTRSPIIPFYWGYCVSDAKNMRKVVQGNESYFTDQYGNILRKDGTWGGGPFQNGTSDLMPFWQEGGFNEKAFFGIIDVNAINPVIGRELHTCPDRLYYVHAARRLANLVKTIREDLPDEPINIVAHSQGTMITLCALFYMDKEGVRGPDTVSLSSSPYRFDTSITDYLAAAGGRNGVASAESRLSIFANAARIVQKAKSNYCPQPAPHAECTHQPVPRHKYDDSLYAHQPPDNPDWQAEIGARDIEPGLKWWQLAAHARDNRGKLFVNFNPGDRVIGVSAVEGIGWRGLPSRLLNQDKNLIGANVMQRIFARGSNEKHNAPVGTKTNYAVSYFFTQIEHKAVTSGEDGSGPAWKTGTGGTLETIHKSWRYLDGRSPDRQWLIPSEQILGLLPALGTLSPPGEGGQAEYVWINAPLVPQGAVLGDDFDGKALRYDGQADPAQGVEADPEQQQDYQDRLDYEDRIDLCSGKPQKISCIDDKGFRITRLETTEEVELRLRNEVGRKLVSPTNHAAILRYNVSGKGGPVSLVLSYDLTVGMGYAWGDETYWNYLLDLADWKKSDPYYKGAPLLEKHGDLPPGIAVGTEIPAANAQCPA